MGTKLNGPKVAVVTGGGKGIGKGIAVELAKRKYDIAIFDIYENGRSVVEELEALGAAAQFLSVDVSDEEQVALAVRTVEDSMGGPDVLVNNAGIFPRSSAIDMPYSMFQKVLHVNLGGAFLCSRHVAPGMLRRGEGVIINIASGRALQGSPNGSHYAASKAGIISLTRSLALEWAPAVRVNAVIPGITDTDQPREVFTTDEALYGAGKNIPLGRIGQPEDTAKLVAYLASADASFITGQSICVNGGAIMQ